jgi:hypothetical protein
MHRAWWFDRLPWGNTEEFAALVESLVINGYLNGWREGAAEQPDRPDDRSLHRAVLQLQPRFRQGGIEPAQGSGGRELSQYSHHRLAYSLC